MHGPVTCKLSVLILLLCTHANACTAESHNGQDVAYFDSTEPATGIGLGLAGPCHDQQSALPVQNDSAGGNNLIGFRCHPRDFVPAHVASDSELWERQGRKHSSNMHCIGCKHPCHDSVLVSNLAPFVGLNWVSRLPCQVVPQTQIRHTVACFCTLLRSVATHVSSIRPYICATGASYSITGNNAWESILYYPRDLAAYCRCQTSDSMWPRCCNGCYPWWSLRSYKAPSNHACMSLPVTLMWMSATMPSKHWQLAMKVYKLRASTVTRGQPFP